jgi:hypothetical protein
MLNPDKLDDASCLNTYGAMCEYQNPANCFYEELAPGYLTSGDMTAGSSSNYAEGLPEADCRRECDAAAPACVGVTFFPGTPTRCSFHDSQSLLHTCANSSVLVMVPTARASIRRCDGETVGCYTRHHEHVITGANTLGIIDQDAQSCLSVQMCGELCANAGGCQGFSYDRTIRKCFLKEGATLAASTGIYDAYIR